jgi:hypothetical protein
VVQAIYCNCFPLLPDRLAYPEHIPAERREQHIYRDPARMVAMLRERILNIEETRSTETRSFVERYDWSEMAPRYDAFFSTLCDKDHT